MAKKYKYPAVTVFSVVTGIKLDRNVMRRIMRRLADVVQEEVVEHAYSDDGHSLVELSHCVGNEYAANDASANIFHELLDALEDQGYVFEQTDELH
jgi:hypothetical protein